MHKVMNTMPKMRCACGEILRWSEIPNPIEWRLLSDVDFDKYQGTVDAQEIYRATKSLMRCPKCDRLWIFWEGFSNPPTEYLHYDPKKPLLSRLLDFARSLRSK